MEIFHTPNNSSIRVALYWLQHKKRLGILKYPQKSPKPCITMLYMCLFWSNQLFAIFFICPYRLEKMLEFSLGQMCFLFFFLSLQLFIHFFIWVFINHWCWMWMLDADAFVCYCRQWIELIEKPLSVSPVSPVAVPSSLSPMCLC